MLKVYLGFFLLLMPLYASTENTFKVECLKNNAKACYEYAFPLISGENANIQDVKETGLSFMRKSCGLGEPLACDVLGKHYYENTRYIAARPYLKQSCERGVKYACEAIGVMYRDGHDCRADDIKSRVFFEKACLLGSADACYNVAMMYRGGFGVSKSRVEEKKFYKKSCDLGLKEGCKQFSTLDKQDRGIETGFWVSIKNIFN